MYLSLYPLFSLCSFFSFNTIFLNLIIFYYLVGRLAHEVGWQYQGIVEKLEEKRKVKGTAYYTKKKAEMKLKRQAIEKAKPKTAVYDKVLEQYGYA